MQWGRLRIVYVGQTVLPPMTTLTATTLKRLLRFVICLHTHCIRKLSTAFAVEGASAFANSISRVYSQCPIAVPLLKKCKQGFEAHNPLQLIYAGLTCAPLDWTQLHVVCGKVLGNDALHAWEVY